MSQTSYSNDPAIGFAGMRADTSAASVSSLLNEEASANLPFGIFVKNGTTDRTCKLPSASTDIVAGLTVASADVDSASLATNGAIAPDDIANVAKKGRFYVLPEQSVTKGDAVYMRYTVDGSDSLLAPGRVRKDAAGTAQVYTVTPTAVNSTIYNMAINGRAYSLTSDASATATEIADAFRTLINADTDNGVTGTGTTTLILTANTAGAPFVVSLGANLAGAATTPNAAKAVLVPGCKFASTASADAPAIIELNLPA